MNTSNFKDKVVIITGSSQGIGKVTAIDLARQGAIIVLNGRNIEKLIQVKNEIKVLGANAVFYCGDISKQSEAKGLIDYTLKTFGKIDILINNAGVSMRGNFSDINPVVFKKVFAINVMAAVNTSLYAIGPIKKTCGSIIFISRVAGIRGLPSNSAYRSSKMALRAIAESIRIEEANSNIHVGLIYVGITEIERGKTTISKNGTLIKLADRSRYNVLSMHQVAKAIINNIKKRKFTTTLSFLGKLNLMLQKISPILVERILIWTNKRYLSRYL